MESIRQNPIYENIEDFPNRINREVNEVERKIENHKFLFIGNARPDFVQESILDITNKRNQKRLKNLLKSYNDNVEENIINIYEE